MSKLTDPKNFPNKEKLTAMNAELTDNFKELVHQVFLVATLTRARYEALVKAGFTEEQAMQIITSPNQHN